MFDPFFDLIAAILAWFYDIWPSYGMSIVFLTLVVMMVTTPLTMKSTRSLMELQLLAPELKKIQQKHRGNRTELSQAQMEFYKEHNLNPMGGCLPLMVQAPVFLVLYRVVMGLTRRATEIGTQLGFTSSRFAVSEIDAVRPTYSPTPIVQSGLRFDPDFLSTTTELYEDLSARHEMVSWGFDLSRSASKAMSEGFIESIPYLLMMGIVLITGLYQQRQVQKRQTVPSDNPMQQTIMKAIPYFLPIVSYTIPAAVVVYFIISALCRIGQQHYIGRSFYSGEESLGAQLARQRKSPGRQDRARGGLSGSGKSRLSRPEASDLGERGSNKNARNSRSKQREHVKKAKISAPVRSSRSDATKRRVSASSRSFEAPSRVSRNRNRSGRSTPPRRKPKHAASNRSKNKKKRR